MTPMPAARSAPPAASRARSRLASACAAILFATQSGCTWVSYLGTDPAGDHRGRTYYLGGAGPLGHVGTIDVPEGLRRAGYRGAIIVFGWQSWVPSTLRDQIDISRNESQAQRLADDIRAYLVAHPDQRVNIIALSAGTGITTWALERLPEEYAVETVIFLGSSLSRNYDLTRALLRVNHRLYNFYSPSDPILRYGVPIAGTVDREFQGPSAAGMFGFVRPDTGDPDTRWVYEQKLRNMAWRRDYKRHGWSGLHTDTTSMRFIQRVVAPLILASRERPPVDAPTPEPIEDRPTPRDAGARVPPIAAPAPRALPPDPARTPATTRPAVPPAAPRTQPATRPAPRSAPRAETPRTEQPPRDE
ncbi:MAG: esterase/lipase family protein [Phycisphaerae bacterium]